MPQLISRAEALGRIRAEGGTPTCLMCAIVEGRVGRRYDVFDDGELLVFLPRYVRRWGHVMILPKEHVTAYLQVDTALWGRANALALHAARMVERVLQPRRCYVASLGSTAGELPQTSSHLHIHVIPLFLPDDKPIDIFSWSDGVYVGEEAEWLELQDRYVRGWTATT